MYGNNIVTGFRFRNGHLLVVALDGGGSIIQLTMSGKLNQPWRQND